MNKFRLILTVVITITGTTNLQASCFEANSAEHTDNCINHTQLENSFASIAGSSNTFFSDQSETINEVSQSKDEIETSSLYLSNLKLALKGSFEASKSSSNKSFSTSYIVYQYTNDGWLQHVAVYSDSVICTNMAGPREGVQFIIANNGAVMDMCHNYTAHKDYNTHKYSWGEVKTYYDYQTVKFK